MDNTGNTDNKIYVLARVDDAGVRQILAVCTDKQEALQVRREYAEVYRQNGFKVSGNYTENSNIPGFISVVRIVPQAAEDADKGKDYATYILEIYEMTPTHPGDDLQHLFTGTIWDFLQKK